jgi:hypothetical protein
MANCTETVIWKLSVVVKWRVLGYLGKLTTLRKEGAAVELFPRGMIDLLHC